MGDVLGNGLLDAHEGVSNLQPCRHAARNAGGYLIVTAVWWAAYMHAFYFAFLVEKGRSIRTLPPKLHLEIKRFQRLD